MSTFDQEMTQHQMRWRKSNIENPDCGRQNGKEYEWILPADDWEQGLWPGIRSGSRCPLPDYLRDNNVQKHLGVNNLKSSWVLCANLYFPFGRSDEARSLLAGFLHQHVSREIRSVDRIELEYAECGDLCPEMLLGEIGGRRGAGQTSPDVAFLVNGNTGLVLTESKFVEHSFYRCSARRRTGSTERPPNPDPTRCGDLRAILDDPVASCHQVTWGRKYWEYLAPILRREMVSTLRGCPAAGAGYQLFRQQALAEGIAASGKYTFVVSCIAIDSRNETLRTCLTSSGLGDIREWGHLFKGKAQAAAFTHQQWVAWVRNHSTRENWSDWLAYAEERYGF